MDKIIKVTPATHKLLKVGASNTLMTMKDFVGELASKNTNGIPYDVDEYDFEHHIAVIEDISNKLISTRSEMTDEQKREWVRAIECVYYDTKEALDNLYFEA